jgi:hypothetical protein
MSPFSAPFSWGTQKREAGASKASGCFMGGDLCSWGGTGKAEDAKLPDAGISPKQCPGIMSGRKGWLTGLGHDRRRERPTTTSEAKEKPIYA